MDLIKAVHLNEKSTQEIKHRYKNLICSKASQNPIKMWKHRLYSPLEDNEVRQLLKGIKWCGNEHRFNVISKYFFGGTRSGSLLEQEYLHKDKLNKKRKKHNYEVTHVKYSQLLANYESLDSSIHLANQSSPQDITKAQNSQKLEDSNSFQEILSKGGRNQNSAANINHQTGSFNSKAQKLENSMQMQPYPYKKFKTDMNQSFSQKPYGNIQNTNINQEMLIQRKQSPEYSHGTGYFRQGSNGSQQMQTGLNSSFSMMGRGPPKFKMINNVTYEYEEI